MADEPSGTQHAHGSYIAQASEGSSATVQVYTASAPQEQNRVRFLGRLRYQYQEMWEQSLQGAALMELGLASRPNAVQHQAELLFRPVQQPERLLPPGTSIVQVYEEAGQELLILGEPGAGKSTLLLDLARHLLGRAEQEAQQPMPVLLPLSTWAIKRQPLADWLVEQVSLLYNVPPRLSSRWVQTDQILPLLDGLDEMPQEARFACIAAITTYHHDHLVPLIVCSRLAEYEELAQQQRLVLHSAVVVQPLSRQQVDAYLIQAGEPLAALRTVLQTNVELQGLITTPLMLSVLSLTYAGASVQDLPFMGSAEEQQRVIFARYIERMIERRRHTSFSLQQTIPWLSWLAQQMQQHKQTVFYLEQLQPDWLPPGRLQRLYELLAVRLTSVVIGVLVSLFVLSFLAGNESSAMVICTGLFGGLVGGLVSGAAAISFQPRSIARAWKHRWRHLLRLGLGVGFLLGISTGLAFALAPDTSIYFEDPLHAGLIFGIGSGLSSLLLSVLIDAGKIALHQKTPNTETISHLRLPSALHAHLHFGVSAGVLFGLSSGLSFWLGGGLSIDRQGFIISGIGFGLANGLYFGIIGLLLSLLLFKREKIIEPAEIIVWSVKRMGNSLTTRSHISRTLVFSLLIGVLFGLIVGLSDVLIVGLSIGLSYGLSIGLSYGLFNVLFYWTIIGFWNSLSRDTLDNNRRIRPNEGIRRSGRNGLLVGLIVGGLGGLINALQSILGGALDYGLSAGVRYGVRYGLRYGLSYGLRYGLSIGLSIGPLVGVVIFLLVALLTGGLAWLQHYLLRVPLWRAGAIPWRYVRFLDEAAGCILLRKVGGGYSFVHRLLLDYFASLTTGAPAVKTLPQADSMVSESSFSDTETATR